MTKLEGTFPGRRFEAVDRVPDGVDLVVNASTVGMRADDGLPGPLGPLAPTTLVGDVIVGEAPTPILRLAQQHGCAFVSGRDMHGGQADAIVQFFDPVLRAA